MDLSSSQPASEKRTMRWFLVTIFVVVGALTAGVVRCVVRHPSSLAAPSVSLWQQSIVCVVALASVVMLVKRLRSWAVWEALFTATLFLGIWYAALLVLPLGYALLAAAGLTLLRLLVPRVIVHDLFYALGACGVAISLCLWLPAEVLLVWLVGFSLYDILAGPPGGPIMELAGNLVRHGVVPGLVIIGRLRDLAAPLQKSVQSRMALLGAGDVILPTALVARAAFHGLYPALAVLAGIALGALGLTRGDTLHPRAALPALAAGASVPFVVMRLLSLI